MFPFHRMTACLRSLALWVAAATVTVAHAATPIIFDTDFVMPPADDGMALMLALQSPEVDILGVTTVAGNDSVERATSDALRLLEIAQRTDIPVHQGANLPLVHSPGEFAKQQWGNWYSDEPPPEPPGGFARKQAEKEGAVEFLTRTVMSRPGEVVIVAIGPLTNIAQAIRAEPGFAASVRQIVIMGGAIASLPDGAGNVTPNAEFNFWVDPEAAHVTLRAGISTVLSPLNVSRKTALDSKWFNHVIAKSTPLTRLLKDTMSADFARDPGLIWLMYDQVAVASVIDPSLVSTRELYVDVDIHHGINYGVSVGGETLWPGAEGSQKIAVQYDVDWERFIRLFAERVQRPLN